MFANYVMFIVFGCINTPSTKSYNNHITFVDNFFSQVSFLTSKHEMFLAEMSFLYALPVVAVLKEI